MSECTRTEPTIEEIMADPTVHALMRADRVNVERLRLKLLHRASAEGSAERRPLRDPRTAGPAPAVPSERGRGQAWG